MTPRIIFLTALLFVSSARAQEWKSQSVFCCTPASCGKLTDYNYRISPAGIELLLHRGHWCRVHISSVEVIKIFDGEPYDECERVHCQGP
jgi:hypothetical protein